MHLGELHSTITSNTSIWKCINLHKGLLCDCIEAWSLEYDDLVELLDAVVGCTLFEFVGQKLWQLVNVSNFEMQLTNEPEFNGGIGNLLEDDDWADVTTLLFFLLWPEFLGNTGHEGIAELVLFDDWGCRAAIAELKRALSSCYRTKIEIKRKNW